MLLFFLSVNLTAQSSDEQQLKDLVQNAFDDILSDLKTKNIPDYFTTDFLLLEHGEVWDVKKLKIMLNADDMKGVVGVNDFDFILVKVKGDFAWMAYHNIATFEKDGEIVGEMNWLESATAVKKENGWRIDMLHSTRMPKAE